MKAPKAPPISSIPLLGRPCGDCGQPVSVKPTKRIYCVKCAKARILASNATSKKNAELGIRQPRANANQHTLRTNYWLIEYLKAHPCACGEIDIIKLEFVPKYRLSHAKVETLHARCRPLGEIQDAAALCTVMCVGCAAYHETMNGKRYRYRIAAGYTGKPVPPPPRLSGRQGQGSLVATSKPQPGEFRGDTVSEPQVASAGSADLPADNVWPKATPKKPANGHAQVDVGDVAPAMAPGEPITEAARGSGDDHAIDPAQQARLEPSVVDDRVVCADGFRRRLRQR